MEILEFTLLLLACVLVSAILDQFIPKVSSPLIQIALGVFIYFFAKGDFNFQINDDVFMFLFVAPLLYNEAKNVSKATMIKNRVLIMSLSIGLVVVLTLAVGFSLNAIVPSIPLAAAFALGAALGPTDSVAVSSLPEEVRLGPRREGILLGECLFNDASGIVAFQCALAAVMTGTFDAVDAGTDFVVLFIGGIVVGIIVGFAAQIISKIVRNRGLENTTFHVLFDVFLPFMVYFAAEAFHVSGILAVVAAGIVSSGFFDKANTKHLNPKVSKMSIVSTSVWDVLIFALNGIVFVYLGTVLPDAIIHLWNDTSIENVNLILYVILIVVVIVGVRFLWIYLAERRHAKKRNELTSNKDLIHSALIMTIGGAKGAVTMSIMFSIPVLLPNGAPFPGRSILLFISAGVVIITLILTNFLLPILMPKGEKLKAKKAAGMKEDLAIATIDVLRQVIEELTSQINDDNRSAIQNVVNSYSKRITMIKKSNDFDIKLNMHARAKAYQFEREFVTTQFRKQNIKPKIARKYLSQLSSKEDLLEHHTSLTWKLKNGVNRTYSYLKLLPKRTKNMAAGEYADPGETTRFDTASIDKTDAMISSMSDLRWATYNHVIKMLEEEIQQSDVPSEDYTNVITDYRNQLHAMKEMSPSITAIRSVNKETTKYTRLALSLEMAFMKEKLYKNEISREQFQHFSDNVLLMQVALEEF